MVNPSKKDDIYLICPPNKFAKILIVFGIFFALLPLVPRDYGLSLDDSKITASKQCENTISRGER